MNRLFGTDGVRGVAGSELTPKLAYALGRAGAFVLAKETARPKILVGKDTRLSGDMLESALIAGICSSGATAVTLGVLPTPAIAYVTRLRGAAAGVVISASHNPAKYNGIKFFSGNGCKLPDETEDAIQAAIESNAVPVRIGADIGTRKADVQAAADYAEFVSQTIPVRLDGIRLAVDCANGATGSIAPSVFLRLGAAVTLLHNEPDGLNINDGCGSTHMESLSDFVKKGQFDLGIAFDGDGDRVLLTDEHGTVIDGDAIMAVCAIAMKAEDRLSKNTLVATVMSNMGLELACQKNGIRLLRTDVGDRYVLEEMLRGGYVLGGEQSGHIIFREHVTTGDGLVSALQFLLVMQKTGKKASELASCITILPQVLRNAHVSNRNKYTYADDTEIASEIARIEKDMHGSGRVLIRPSGTEPRIRIMLEGSDMAHLESDAELLQALIEEKLGH